MNVVLYGERTILLEKNQNHEHTLLLSMIGSVNLIKLRKGEKSDKDNNFYQGI